MEDFFRSLCGVGLADRYAWGVIFALNNQRSVKVWCDPSGVLAILRDRDPDPGVARRKALLHWVTRHSRIAPDGDSDVAVRAHLRGKQPVRWRGWDCTLVPSRFDAQQAKAEWRGEHGKAQA